MLEVNPGSGQEFNLPSLTYYSSITHSALKILTFLLLPIIVSAYSIFNEDFRELPGTLNADRLDRDIRAGQF